MKICPNCGKENLDKPFCTECGFDITEVKPVAKVNVIVTNKATGKPVSNAIVTIRNEDVSLESITDIDGCCIIKNVSFGNSIISAEYDGYMKSVDSVTVDEDDVFVEISIKEKKSTPKPKSKLKIIGVLILIIAILCAGLYLVMNQNNTQSISDTNNYTEDNSYESVPVSDVNNMESEFQIVDFNGLFKINLPVECDFSELYGNSNVDADYTWQNGNSESYYDSIYYFEGYANLNDVLSKFSISSYEFDGDLILFDDFDGDIYVGIQSSDNRFVLLKASNVNELDNLKQSANSIVFE